MSLKRLILEDVATDRKKQALVSLSKVLFKSYDKSFYMKLRKRFESGGDYLSKTKFTKMFSTMKSRFVMEDDVEWIEDDEDTFLDVAWVMTYTMYALLRNTDLTDNGKYINWLIHAWVSPKLWAYYGRMDKTKIKTFFSSMISEVGIYDRFQEDTYKYTELLKKFEKLKNLDNIEGDEADINNYDTVEELFEKVKELESDPEVLKSRRERVEDDTKVIYEDKEWKFIVPESHEASCTWGSGTNWCTAVDGNDIQYNEHMEQGDLIIMINDKRDRKFQAHYMTGVNYPQGWFMNERDEYGIPEFYDLVGEERFTKYIGIITYWSNQKTKPETLLSEFDVLCDEFNDLNLNVTFYPIDFVGDQVLKAMTEDLVNIIDNHRDQYTELAKDIMQVLEVELPYDHKGRLRDKWDLIMVENKGDIINDVFWSYKNEVKETGQAIKNYFESLIK